jgi:hypothetical protein
MTMSRPTSIERDEALLTGSRAYIGQECWCGSAVRYVKGGACVECAKKNAKLAYQQKLGKPTERLEQPMPGDIGPASHEEPSPWD